jgi:ABC-2 type transport system permease protein
MSIPDGTLDGQVGAPHLRHAYGLRAVVHREYRLVSNNRVNLLLSLLPTAIYLLLFATSIATMVTSVVYRGETVAYGNFVIPTVLLSAVLAGGVTTGTSLFQEELGRMHLELWSHPITRVDYIGGKIVATTALVLGQSVAALLVGVFVYDVRWPASHWLSVLVGVVVTSLVFNTGYLLVAALVRDFRHFMVLVNVIGPVLLFASPSFYPTDRMPVVLQWLSVVDPVTYGVTYLRDSAVFGFADAALLGAALLGSAAVLLVALVAVLNRRIQQL